MSLVVTANGQHTEFIKSLKNTIVMEVIEVPWGQTHMCQLLGIGVYANPLEFVA